MNINDEKYLAMRHRILKRKFSVAKNQARMRGQEWTITFEYFCDLWDDNRDSWLHSGQAAEDYNMSRKNMDLGWTPENVHIIPRSEMLANHGAYRRLLNQRKRGKSV